MNRFLMAALAAALLQPLVFAQSGSVTVKNGSFTVLRARDYRHYAAEFAADELAATGKQPSDEWPWMEANIPLFDSSNKRFEEMYYFRWYAWQKHLVRTPRGYVITEWLP
ncbi:MAG: hypothetical protein WBE38_04835, partial [Terracidiphilus sp.]